MRARGPSIGPTGAARIIPSCTPTGKTQGISMPGFRRTHTCGELRDTHAGQSVTLNGWVHTWRDHGQFVFVDLRDRYGITQVVFEVNRDKALFEAARELRGEFCIAV